MSLVSLLTLFCFVPGSNKCVLTEKMSRNPTSSLFSFLCCTPFLRRAQDKLLLRTGASQLINAVFYHVFTFFKIKCKVTKIYLIFSQLSFLFYAFAII